eukprot:185776-Prymnesium_polylepis.2
MPCRKRTLSAGGPVCFLARFLRPCCRRLRTLSAAPLTDTACRLVLGVVRGSPGTVFGRLKASDRSPVSPLSLAATGDHRPDPDCRRLSDEPHSGRSCQAIRLGSDLLTLCPVLSRLVQLM